MWAIKANKHTDKRIQIPTFEYKKAGTIVRETNEDHSIQSQFCCVFFSLSLLFFRRWLFILCRCWICCFFSVVQKMCPDTFISMYVWRFKSKYTRVCAHVFVFPIFVYKTYVLNLFFLYKMLRYFFSHHSMSFNKVALLARLYVMRRITGFFNCFFFIFLFFSSKIWAQNCFFFITMTILLNNFQIDCVYCTQNSK